jgi:hypothetical protein
MRIFFPLKIYGSDCLVPALDFDDIRIAAEKVRLGI